VRHWFQGYRGTGRWVWRRAYPNRSGQIRANTRRKAGPNVRDVSLSIQRPCPNMRFAMLCPWQGLCYNHRAVESAGKLEPASSASKRDAVVSAKAESAPHDPRIAAEGNRSANVDRFALAADVDRTTPATSEDPSRYCPVCSRRLESKRCKLICTECGYYMSCADYY
jgi:hypothetical protein